MRLFAVCVCVLCHAAPSLPLPLPCLVHAGQSGVRGTHTHTLLHPTPTPTSNTTLQMDSKPPKFRPCFHPNSTHLSTSIRNNISGAQFSLKPGLHTCLCSSGALPGAEWVSPPHSADSRYLRRCKLAAQTRPARQHGLTRPHESVPGPLRRLEDSGPHFVSCFLP